VEVIHDILFDGGRCIASLRSGARYKIYRRHGGRQVERIVNELLFKQHIMNIEFHALEYEIAELTFRFL